MLNRIILMGRLTRDPELRHTQTGTPVASFSLAVDRDFKDKTTGEKLDKDRFRRDMGGVEEAYQEIMKRVMSK